VNVRTLKITIIATLIATAASFWAAGLGLTQRVWPQHPQLAGFFISLVACIVVPMVWPKEWLGGDRKKD
jgi:hypothetical protein